jgi:CelD/BcsL family acetyltransferase involved in cellulose biosynthesis
MTSDVLQKQGAGVVPMSSPVPAATVPPKPAERRFQLRYSIGDVCLFRASFRAVLQDAPFGPDVEPQQRPFPDPVPPGASVSGVIGARVAGRLPTIGVSRRGVLYVRNQTVNYYVDMRGTFAEYWNGFSSKTRSTLNRKVRKLASVPDGDMQCRLFRAPAEVQEFHALARRVAANTYQEKLFDGAIPSTPEFVAKLRALAAADSFRGFILSVKGSPVAYLYLPVSDGILTYGYLGYEPAYSDWSPGTVLLQLAIEELFAAGGFRYFDFTYGESPTKKLFGREKFLRADVYLFRWTPRNIVLLALHVALDKSSTALGRLLAAIGVRQAVRRFLRRTATT